MLSYLIMCVCVCECVSVSALRAMWYDLHSYQGHLLRQLTPKAANKAGMMNKSNYKNIRATRPHDG